MSAHRVVVFSCDAMVWEDMEYLHKDSLRIQYIECPVCHAKVCVRDNGFGWLNGVERIYEEKVTEEV